MSCTEWKAIIREIAGNIVWIILMIGFVIYLLKGDSK